MSRSVRTRIAVVVVIVLAGCSIRPASSPSDVPEDQRGGFGADPATGDEAAGSSLIFLVAPAESGAPAQLRSVLRDVDNDTDAVLDSLLSGPNAAEQAEQIDTALPADLEILGTRTLGRVTTIDLTDGLDELDPVDLRLAIGQLVATATAIPDVDAVQIRVAGEPTVWPRGDGTVTDEPLSTYDFPGMIESTQPDYPAFSG